MMSSQPSSAALRPGFYMFVLATIVVLFAVRNLPWHLDDYDQAKQAFSSFQIVHGGGWLYQLTPDGEIATKPPFAGWISTLLYWLCGRHGWDIAWRLPSFICALLVLRTLARSGEELCGHRLGALLAAGMFGLNSFTPRLATLVRTDMLLATLIFFIGWLTLEKLRTGGPWTRREQWFAFALFLAALMTKGPIVYAFILPGWIAFHFVARRWKLPGHARPSWWTLVVPLIVFVFWAGYGIATNPLFYEQVVHKEFLGRFTVGEHAAHHNFFPGWYTLNLLAKALPWSLLFILIFSVRNVWSAMRNDSALLWLACWTFGGLVFMEFVPSKRFDRIFPVLAPACLLLAAAARHLPDGQWRRLPLLRLASWATIIGLIGAVGYTVSRMVANQRDNGRVLVRFGQGVARTVADRQDRLAIVHARDEGLLLYADHTHFDSFQNVEDLWRAGGIDWVVVGDDYFAKAERKLASSKVLAEIPKMPGTLSGYRFLERSPDPAGSSRPDFSLPNTKSPAIPSPK